MRSKVAKRILKKISLFARVYANVVVFLTRLEKQKKKPKYRIIDWKKHHEKLYLVQRRSFLGFWYSLDTDEDITGMYFCYEHAKHQIDYKRALVYKKVLYEN